METLEKLKKANKLIAQLNSNKFVVAVEGKRDEASLRNVGVECQIIQANGSQERVVRKIAATGLKPIVLFDFDATGNEREKRLIELLLANGLVPDAVLRRKFQHVFGMRFFEDVDKKWNEILEKIEKQRN